MGDTTDSKNGTEELLPEEPGAPTGMLLVDLGWLARNLKGWRNYKLDLLGFFLGWVFVAFIMGITVLLARIGS